MPSASSGDVFFLLHSCVCLEGSHGNTKYPMAHQSMGIQILRPATTEPLKFEVKMKPMLRMRGGVSEG